MCTSDGAVLQQRTQKKDYKRSLRLFVENYSIKKVANGSGGDDCCNRKVGYFDKVPKVLYVLNKPFVLFKLWELNFKATGVFNVIGQKIVNFKN